MTNANHVDKGVSLYIAVSNGIWIYIYICTYKWIIMDSNG